MRLLKKRKTMLCVKKDGDVKRLEIYHTRTKTFQLFCDVKKQIGVGMNTNYCLSILTANGFVPVIDNRTLGIPDVKADTNKNELMNAIEFGFEKFIVFADNL